MSFTFQCPHCGEMSRIELDRVGSAAACSACGLPFSTAVPAGRLMVEDGEAGLRPASMQGDAVLAEQGEKTVLTVNPAPFRERPIGTVLMAGLILAGLTGLIVFGGRTETGWGYAALTAASALAAVVCALVLAGWFVLSRFESLTVTNQRSIWARGVINRRSSEVQHDDIRNIQVQQNLIQRLVGAGTIAVSSAGQDDMEIVARGIPGPHRVIEAIRTHQRRLVKGD